MRQTLPNNATEALDSLADGAYERVRDAAVRLVAFRRYDAASGDLLSEARMYAPGRHRVHWAWSPAVVHNKGHGGRS